MTEKRTPEGRLLRQAVSAMESGLAQTSRTRADLSVRASSDGSFLGSAQWSRETGWAIEAEVMRNLKQRGGGYVSLRVEKSW